MLEFHSLVIVIRTIMEYRFTIIVEFIIMVDITVMDIIIMVSVNSVMVTTIKKGIVTITGNVIVHKMETMDIIRVEILTSDQATIKTDIVILTIIDLIQIREQMIGIMTEPMLEPMIEIV
jgi:hypothetical protein